MEATKRCLKCKTIKPIYEFNRNNSRKDGLHYYCKSCCKTYRQSTKGKDVRKRYDQKYHQTAKGKATRSRAIKKYYKTTRGHLKYLFNNILYKCNNPKNQAYKDYGGRGIKVKFASFDDFYDYVVNELKADPRDLAIDRIDNNGHYEHGNIRFISQAENNRNKRPVYRRRRND